jgi:hypothetical protein
MDKTHAYPAQGLLVSFENELGNDALCVLSASGCTKIGESLAYIVVETTLEREEEVWAVTFRHSGDLAGWENELVADDVINAEAVLVR